MKRWMVFGLVFCMVMGVFDSVMAAKKQLEKSDKGDAKVNILLYAPFDGTADAKIAKGNKTALTSGEITYEKGKVGVGILIDKDDTCTFETDGNFNKNEGTVMFWIKPRFSSEKGVYSFFFMVQGHAYNRNRLSIKFAPASGKILAAEVYGGDMVSRLVKYPVKFEADEWHHLALVWKGSEGMVKLYWDGAVLDAVPANPGPYEITFLSGKMKIGTDFQNGCPAHAVIDELYIYDKALTGDQIKKNLEAVGW